MTTESEKNTKDASEKGTPTPEVSKEPSPALDRQSLWKILKGLTTAEIVSVVGVLAAIFMAGYSFGVWQYKESASLAAELVNEMKKFKKDITRTVDLKIAKPSVAAKNSGKAGDPAISLEHVIVARTSFLEFQGIEDETWTNIFGWRDGKHREIRLGKTKLARVTKIATNPTNPKSSDNPFKVKVTLPYSAVYFARNYWATGGGWGPDFKRCKGRVEFIVSWSKDGFYIKDEEFRLVDPVPSEAHDSTRMCKELIQEKVIEQLVISR